MFSTFVQTKVAKAYRGGASEVTSSNNRMCGVFAIGSLLVVRD